MEEEALLGDASVVVPEGTVDQPHFVSPDLVDAQEELLGLAEVQVTLADVC